MSNRDGKIRVFVPQKFIAALKPDDVITPIKALKSQVNIDYLSRLLHGLHKRSGGTRPYDDVSTAIIDMLTTWEGLDLINKWDSGNLDPIVVMNQINRMVVREAPKHIKWLVKSADRVKYNNMNNADRIKYLEHKIKHMDEDPELNVFRQTNELGKRWDRMMPDDYHELDNFMPEIPVNPHELTFQKNEGEMLAPHRRYGWANMGNWRHRFDADEGRDGTNYKERTGLHTKRNLAAFQRDPK